MTFFICPFCHIDIFWLSQARNSDFIENMMGKKGLKKPQFLGKFCL